MVLIFGPNLKLAVLIELVLIKKKRVDANTERMGALTLYWEKLSG